MTVRPCTHDWENGECKICHEICSPHTFDECGKCEKCGLACLHEHVTESGGVYTCDDCNAKMLVKVNETYYARINDRTGNADTLNQVIRNAPNGSTVKLLADGLLAFAYIDEKTITLDMNGKTITETGQGITVGAYGSADSKLYVIGGGSSEDTDKWKNPQAFRVRAGTIDFTDRYNDSGKFEHVHVDGGKLIFDTRLQNLSIGTLEFEGNGEASFWAGSFDKIAASPAWNGSVKLGTLLKQRSSCSFKYTGDDGEYLLYDTVITKDTPVENVTIEESCCLLGNLDEENTCKYCGTKHIVAIRINDSGSYAPYSADEYTEESLKEYLGYAFDGWNRNGGTLRLYMDAVLSDMDCTVRYRSAIDLNGHKVTGGKMTIKSNYPVTITDSSEGKTGVFENITVDNGSRLIVDGVEVSNIAVCTEGSTVLLKEGSRFKSINLTMAKRIIADCLPDNCYIANLDGSAAEYVLEAMTTSSLDGFVVKRLPETVSITVGENKNGSVPYRGTVPTSLFPVVTTTDGSTPDLTYQWYYKNADGALQPFTTAKSDGNGGYTWQANEYAFSLLNIGDELDVVCIITARNGDEVLWNTSVSGYTLTVTAGNLAGATVTPTNADALIYTPSSKQQLEFYVEHNGNRLTMGTDFEIKDESDLAKNAAEHTLVLTGLGKYAGSTLEYKWTVSPRELTGISKITKAYDGTSNLPEEITFAYSGGEITLTSAGETPDYTVSGEYHSANAKAAKDANATITLKNKNYTFSGGETESFFIYEIDNKAEITKAAAPGEKSGALTVYNNRTADYECDISALLPTLGDGKRLGTVDYSKTWTLANDKYTVTEIELDEHGQLSLHVEAPDETAEGVIGSFTIIVKSENYQDFHINVLVKASNRLISTGEPTLSRTEITYGDTVSSISLGGALKYGDKDVTGDFEWISGSVVPDAGYYDAEWKFTPNDDIYSEVISKTTITVNEADCTYTVPTAEVLTYNGSEQTLVTAGSASGGTMYYSLDGASWSENVPQKTNADDYTVYYKIVGDKNHKDVGEQPINVSIAKLPVTIDWSNTEGHVYDGSEKTVSATVTNAVSGDSVDITLGGTYKATDKGDYVAEAASLDNPNYTLEDGTNTSVNWSIAQATNKVENLTIIGWTYGESANAPSASAKFGDIVYSYASEKDGIYGSTVPSDAGTYWVKASVSGCENYTFAESEPVQFEIARKDITGASYGEFGLTYNGGEQTPAAAVTTSDGFTVTGSWSKVKNVSDKTTFTASGNFYGTIADVDTRMERLSVASAIIALGDSLVYNGNDQTQAIESIKVGELTLTADDYDISGNTGKLAVEYTLTVTGKGNFSGTAEKKFTIAKLPVTINWSNTEGHVYDGSEKTVSATVTNAASGDSVDITLGGTYKATDKGDYVAEAASLDNPNYTLEDGTNTSVNWSIAQATNKVENLTIIGWTYGESANAPSASARFGDIVYSYASEKDGIYGSTVPSNAGTHWVKASVSGCENYTAAESEPVQFEIARKSVEGANVGAFGEMTYNGKAQTPNAEVVIDGLKATGTWSEVTNVTDTTDFTASGNFIGTITGKATGMAKKSIEDAVIAPANVLTYNGTEQTLNVTITLDDLTVTYDISGNKATDVKTDGDYTLTVTGNGNFEGSKNLDWNISPATPVENAEKKTTARVLRGKTLADAKVSNGEFFAIDGTTVLEGTFAWVDGTKVMKADGTEQMKFSPNDNNYCDVILDVAVNTYSSGGDGSSSSSYTVKFDTNGGSKVLDVKVSKNDKVKEPTAPSKDGFEFAGWFIDKGLKDEYDFDTKVTNNFTLYAAWTEVTTEPKPTDKPENLDKENPFDDISKDDWYYNDVINSVEKGLFTGTGNKTFAPNDIVTRGMFVTVLYRAEEKPALNKSIPFEDVSKDKYYADAVIWAEQNEIVKGLSETEFAPNKNITREQLAAIMFRYAKYKGYDVTQGGMQIREFDDFESISDYAMTAMTWAVNTGLMKGKTETTINPQDNATRAEIAAILNRFIEANR